MPNPQNFNYLSRDFESLKRDLANFAKVYYPNKYNDFSEGSPGMMLLEMVAYVGDILSHHTDQTFNELFLDTAQQRSSVIRLAENLGYSPKGRAGAVTLLDITINVPVLGDSPDSRYYLTLSSGFRAKSENGVYFEVLEDVDFSQHTSLAGVKNRTIVPVYNSSNEIVSYNITKSVVASAGLSKTATLEITSENAIPYLKWNLDPDDTTITEVLNVVSKSDRYPPNTESSWTEEGGNTVWYKVNSLAQERVFVDTTTGQTATTRQGYDKYIDKRFITRWDENGNVILTFGAGVENASAYSTYLVNGLTGITAAALLNNDSLGTIPVPGTYLHCRYRTGGGSNTNVAQNKITTVDKYEMKSIPGGASLPSATVSSVVQSISVNNPIPAIGGSDFPTIDEIKQLAKKNFSSQDRCVTVDDYIVKVQDMPSQYGNVFRVFAEADEQDLNTNIFILTKDEDGKLKNTGNEQIKLNVASYLKRYRILNDFVQIYDGRIVNLSIKFTVHVESGYNKKKVIVNCIDQLRQYFDISKWNMNQPIYISQVTQLLRSLPGVVNVVSLQFYNKIGGNYSRDVLPNTRIHNLSDIAKATQEGEVEIYPTSNTIYSSPTTMFEIKYPETDIMGNAI